MRRKNKSTRHLAKSLKVFFVAFLIVFGLGFAKGVSAESIPDKAPASGVYDPHGYLSQDVVKKVEGLNEKYRKMEKKPQIAVAIIDSLDGNLEEVANKSIADARAKIGSNSSAKEKTVAQGELDSAISRLLVLTENYPTLRSNEQVQSLIVELEGTENRIYVARTDYNATVTKYNKSIRSFPKNIIANSFGFKEKELVNATKDAQTKVPTVDLSNK